LARAGYSLARRRIHFPRAARPTNVWVRVSDPRFALDTFRIDESPGDFRLGPARPVTFEIRADDTGTPLAGARVTIITDRLSTHPHFCATEYGILGPRSVPEGAAPRRWWRRRSHKG
jgi:hypothetical protein